MARTPNAPPPSAMDGFVVVILEPDDAFSADWWGMRDAMTRDVLDAAEEAKRFREEGNHPRVPDVRPGR